jgi:hypothetical protein
MDGELFATTPATMNQARLEFGNAQGLEVADRLSRLEDLTEQVCKQLKNLESEVTELKPYFKDILTIRSSILDEPTGLDRNAVVHGGNVIADLKAMDQISADPPTAYRWQTSFTTYYKIPFTAVKAYLPEAPRQVIESLNLRMDINFLHMWRDPRTHCANLKGAEIKSIVGKRSEAERACDAVINSWYKSLLDGEPIVFASPDMEAAFQQIESIGKEVFAIFHRAKCRSDSDSPA